MPNTCHPALPSLTSQLNGLAEGGLDPGQLAEELRRLAPDLAAQIETDARCQGTLQLWGTSSRADASHPEKPTVHAVVLSAIGLLAGGIDMSGDTVHAGLMHTYGYLLSNLKTPFGFKRQRYTQNSIARGLGLRPLAALSPWPPEGSLLANLTRVAGAIALPAAALEVVSGDAKSLSAFDPSAFERVRMLERVDQVGGNELGATLAIQTDLISLRDHGRDDFSYLLVYSILSGSQHRLVTAFPVQRWALGKLRKRCEKVAGRGGAKIRLRYNARLAGFEGQQLCGRVELVETGR